MPWTPILADEIKDLACHKIHEIAEIISTKDFRQSPPGLMAGNTGIALFLYHYWQWSGKDEYYEKASELLLESMDKIVVPFTQATTPLTIQSSFYEGVAGIGWAINHLMTHNVIEGDVADSMGTIEPWLYRRMIYDLQQSKLGLLQGATGVGLYAAGRDNRVAKEYLRRFVTELFEQVVTNPVPSEGFSIPEGIAGLYLLLVKIRDKHADFEGLDQLLDFYEQRIQARIQQILLEKGASGACELGWRQEEVGLLACVLRSQSVGTDAYNDLKTCVINSFQDELSELRFFDSGLAGGLVSAGHIFNWIYHYTQDEKFGQLARQLFEKELQQATFEEPLTGHQVWLTESNGLYGLHLGLLEGLSGIGLALIAAVSDQEPHWDECLLLS